MATRKRFRGKFKSFHNVSDNVASLMMRTFYALLALSDLKAATRKAKKPKPEAEEKKKTAIEPSRSSTDGPVAEGVGRLVATGLHYNIQIHLPASKDVEVYNAIFKSLREHLLEE